MKVDMLVFSMTSSYTRKGAQSSMKEPMQSESIMISCKSYFSKEALKVQYKVP
jgi:hypothetical protein